LRIADGLRGFGSLLFCALRHPFGAIRCAPEKTSYGDEQ
jgi:hypothetical protein